MEVKLLTSPASLKDMEQYAALAALTCHANTEKPYVPQEVLGRIIKLGHESILEHINLKYSVKGLSRACLQEVSRHRYISLSVESTRHTLKQYMEKGSVLIYTPKTMEQDLRRMIYGYLKVIYEYLMVHPEVPNDHLKYAIPEAIATNLILTVNIRELRHILKLRTAPAALNEFRVLAYSLYEAVPEEYRYMLEDCVYQEACNE